MTGSSHRALLASQEIQSVTVSQRVQRTEVLLAYSEVILQLSAHFRHQRQILQTFYFQFSHCVYDLSWLAGCKLLFLRRNGEVNIQRNDSLAVMLPTRGEPRYCTVRGGCKLV